MTNSNHTVLIAGGGPTGLMLAAELALAKVGVAIIERRETQDLPGARAGGLHARTIEVLDQRGVAERFLSAGKIMQVTGFGMVPIDIGDFPSRHPYGLALFQNHIERILADWVAELGVPILRGRTITALSQDAMGVDVTTEDGETHRAEYVVGCDGGRSVVRKHAGIGFPGWDASVSFLIAEASMSEEPPKGVKHGPRGVNGVAKLEEPGRVRIVLVEPEVRKGETPSEDDLRAALVAVFGSDFGLHDVTWASRFSDAARQAATYRAGRVLLAGDAAHIHAPTGGQGLNMGVQDAVNLGWKLARVAQGTAPESLLDTYEAERHPVAARVLKLTLAQIALGRGDDRTNALRETLGDLLGLPEARKRYGGIMSGLELRYELGPGVEHALVGRRVPDLELQTNDGPRRMFSFLHEAKPVLLELGQRSEMSLEGWLDRVPRVVATYEGPWELPVIGPVPAPTAVLVRPDGYVAWASEGSAEGLREALERWFGPPSAPGV